MNIAANYWGQLPMLKLLGAIFMILACGGAGSLVARGLHTRRRELRAFRYGISALQTEISYGLNPLPRALLRAAKEAGGAVGAVFEQISAKLLLRTGESAAGLWQNSLHEHKAKLPFTEEDMALLQQFGVGLGESDAQDQLRRLKLLETQVQAQEEKAAETALQMGKIWQSLGWGTGIVLALLFI